MTTTRHQAMPASARASVQRCSPDADLTARFMREVVPLRERLYRHAFSLTRDHYEAEDLVQDHVESVFGLPIVSTWNKPQGLAAADHG